MNAWSRAIAFLFALYAAGCSASDATGSTFVGGGGEPPINASSPPATSEPTMPTQLPSSEGPNVADASGATTVVVDPSVVFEWPETTEQAGPCEAGTYKGTFECDMPAQGVTIEFSGPVEFTLEPSASGEFLEIRDGHMTASVINGAIPMQGDLAGQLDCATNAFAATIVNGTYTVFIFTGPFEGDMNGSLDRATNTLSGTWSLNDANNPMTGCTGPWTAVKQP